jgi:hypothetical protein
MEKNITYGIIGDIHGSKLWKVFIQDTSVDHWIFLGDYVDSFNVDNMTIKSNLIDIIRFKKDDVDNVTLLLGNHDIQYIFNPNYICSGFRPEISFDLQQIFEEDRKLFQASYQVDNYLFTHAGVHKGFYKFEVEPHIEEDDINLADTLNRMYEMNMKQLFNIGYLRGGPHSVGGIFWADKVRTSEKPLKGYHQVIGHTRIDKITTINKDETTSITYCDCLGSNNPDFYKLTINNK